MPSGILPKIPAVVGQVLLKGGDETDALNSKDVTKYRSRTALCMYKMQWSRLNIYNATRDCARHMSALYSSHQKALDHLMKYVIVQRIEDWYSVLIESGTEEKTLSFVSMEDRIWIMQQLRTIEFSKHNSKVCDSICHGG